MKEALALLILNFILLSSSQGAGGGAVRDTPNRAAELVAAFKSAKGGWIQLEVADEMIKLGDRSVIKEVEKYLRSENRTTRCNAGLVLTGLGDGRGFRTIIAELQDRGPRSDKEGPSPYLPPESYQATDKRQIRNDRYYAASILRKLRDSRAVPIMLGYLSDEDINYQVAIILGEIGDKRAVPSLKHMLSHKNRDRRLWAGYGLAKLGDPLGVPVVVEFLKDPQWVQRRHAAEALGTFGDRRAVPALLESLQDQQGDIRVSAARALGKLGDERALAGLTRLLADYGVTTSGTTVTVKETAEEAIRQIQTKQEAR